MENKPVAIVLGGTYPHKTLINKLKKRGYYTILIDYYQNPPAKADADQHIQESTLDKEAVLDIAKNRKASLVISTCIDQANVTACYVSEKLGLFAPYSYQTALKVTDKALMKQIMSDNQIQTSKYIITSDPNEIDLKNLNFPVIVKPTDSNSSKGVKKVSDFINLKQYLSEALEISKNNKAIVEEFMIGREIGVDCMIINQKANLILTRERTKISNEDGETQQIYGSFWPANLSITNIEKFKSIATKIANVFNLDNTPLLIQAIINDKGISIIEFAPRIGGGDNYNIISDLTGYDIIESGIKSFLNIELDSISNKPKTTYFDNYIYTHGGIFNRITGLQKLQDDGIIEYFKIYKSKGMQIGHELSSNNRVGVFIVKGNSRKEIFDKILTAIDRIEVCDNNDNSILRKDIYLTLEN